MILAGLPWYLTLNWPDIRLYPVHPTQGPCISATSNLYKNYSTKTPYQYIVEDLGKGSQFFFIGQSSMAFSTPPLGIVVKRIFFVKIAVYGFWQFFFSTIFGLVEPYF